MDGKSSMSNDNGQQVMLSEQMLLQFPLLEKITNGFSADQIIGRGGFSVVYKVYAVITTNQRESRC
jgi:coatomer subunit beta'